MTTTVNTFLARVDAVTAETLDKSLAALVAGFADMGVREAHASFARSRALVKVAALTSGKDAAAAFGVGGSQVSNVKGAVTAWLAMGLDSSEGTVGAAWFHASTTTGLRQVWSTKRGEAIVEKVAALASQDEKVAALLAEAPEAKPEVTPEAAFLAALQSAANRADGESAPVLALTADEVAQARDFLARIMTVEGLAVASALVAA